MMDTSSSLQDTSWRVKLSDNWDVLGPFPIHAREQHFLSPSFPISLSDPIDYSKSWPSSYADGGMVAWTKCKSNDNGDLKLSFPQIRWTALRATEGWAALQHHSVLKTSIVVFPPSEVSPEAENSLRLHVQLLRGSFFTILPSQSTISEDTQSDALAPKWYSGNIYDMEQAPAQILDFPVPPSTASPTTYDILVSGDYEIRLFGDPRTYSDSDIPVLSINLAVQVEPVIESVVWDSTQDVTCDFIDGFAFGDALGVGLRSVNGWWTVKNVHLSNDHIDGVSVHLHHETRIAPTQTRIVPIRFLQSKPLTTNELFVNVTLASATYSAAAVTVSLPIRHIPGWTSASFKPIKASHFFAGSMPTSFVVLPPIEQNGERPCPPILALHGAGVKILEHDFWTDSLARQKRSWVVIPAGRTSWGLDWHGPSAQDAWASVNALFSIVDNNVSWHPWKLVEHTPVVLIGHSNGGQGAWFLASRYPDRVLAVVPAAGYIKSQSYVPLTMSRSARFSDPALLAILDTAFTPDDNDLFLSNMVDTPVLAIHGGNDDNVPTWHSRQAIDVLKSWNPSANVSYHESAGQPHWWPSVLKNGEVQSFIDAAVSKSASGVRARSKTFTLTVAIPSESGSFHGWKIESLEFPGRLGRLHVEDKGNVIKVQTTNVHTFSIDLRVYGVSELLWNGKLINVPPEVTGNIFIPRLWRDWGVDPVEYQLTGRMQAVLATAAPISFVIPDHIPSREFSIALRIAHDLNKYHKLDSEIIRSSEIWQRCEDGSLGGGNIVVVGDSQTSFTRWCMTIQGSAFDLSVKPFELNGRQLENSLGILFLHQHPKYRRANVLFMLGDDPGIERAARLFPIRTGITVPDWLLIGTGTDKVAAAGLTGAGVWARNWEWDDRGSWLH